MLLVHNLFVNTNQIIKETKIDFSYSGDYNKFQVAKNIAKAVNQAKIDGFNINTHSWKSIWDPATSKWITRNDHSWCGILGSVLMYSNCIFYGPKINAVANVLGVEREWILGFCSALSGDYKGTVARVCKRKSKKGQQCRDGAEFGKFFKLAYLPDFFFQWYFSTTTEEFYHTHKWEPLEENKIFITLGMNYYKDIKKCSECNMYGGIGHSNFYNKKECSYHINDIWDSEKYKYKDTLDLSCNEIIIKNLLS